MICHSERERRIFNAGREPRTSMAATYLMLKILHFVQNDKEKVNGSNPNLSHP